MITDTAVLRSGVHRGGAAAGGLRGLPAPCCSACAGLGDDSATGGILAGVPNWLWIAAIGLGAVASGILIYDRFKPARRRRPRVGSSLVYYTPSRSGKVGAFAAGRQRRATRGERRTQQIPIETMSEVVYGKR